MFLKDIKVLKFNKKREMLAFTHIEKAAGTSLIHLLRVNYFMKYCDVMPLSIKSSGILRADDLRKIMIINPAFKMYSRPCYSTFHRFTQCSSYD